MMNLITFAFTIASEKQAAFVQAVEALQKRWRSENITVSLFRDAAQTQRLLLLFLTEKPVDEVTQMIKDADRAGALVEYLKTAEGSIAVSCMEQVL